MVPVRDVSIHRLLLAVLCSCALCGCVSRRMTIRSNPPGALVEVDGRRLGFTPISFDFTYYATYEVTLSKVGYETVTVQQPVPPPWYQIFPLDFVSDNLLPYRVTNRHEFTYELQPMALIPDDDLLGRAANVRSQAEVGP